MIQRATIVIAFALLVGCAHQQKREMSATTLPTVFAYAQDFSTPSNWDVDRDGVKLKWCDTKEWNSLGGCDERGSMRIVKSGGDSIVCICFDGLAYSHASIKLKYYHLRVDDDAANSAGSKLQVRTSADADPTGSATDGVYMTVADLNATSEAKPKPVCTSAEAGVELHAGDKTVYFKILKGKYPRALTVDDVQISLTASDAEKK